MIGLEESRSQVLEFIKLHADSLSKHALEEIVTQTNHLLREKYPKKSHKPRYGHLSKYIPLRKFEQILDAIKSDRMRTMFWLMRKLALRIGEAVRLNISQIDLAQMHIFMQSTEKSHMPDMCYLDEEGVQKIREYINLYNEEINQHGGFLFFPDYDAYERTTHISVQRASDYFRDACKDASLQICYGLSYNTNRQLNLYTTHSCRHSGITDFYIKTKDIRLTQIYARHQSIKSTIIYIHCTEEDMRKAVSSKVPNLSPQDYSEFLHTFEEFKKTILLTKESEERYTHQPKDLGTI